MKGRHANWENNMALCPSLHQTASLWIGLALCCSPAGLWSAETFTAVTGSEKPAKTAKAKKPKSPKPPKDKGTGESQAERDQRLWRECKGKANAGACEGFAR